MEKTDSYVNGPINCIRLEGKVGQTKKVIHLFMYWSTNPDEQTKCDDIRALDINTYLVRQFDSAAKSKPNQVYDFMYNKGPLTSNFNPNARGTYENRVAEIFEKSFEINLDENKVKKSKSVPNVRFHYTGVLDYALHNSPNVLFGEIQPIINNIWHSRTYDANTLINLHNSIKKIGDEVVYINELCFGSTVAKPPKMEKSVYVIDPNKKSDIQQEDILKLTQILINKIKNKYANESVKKIMNTIINTEFKKILDGYFVEEKKMMEEIGLDIEFLKKLGDYSPFDILQQHQDNTWHYYQDRDLTNAKLLFFKSIFQKLSEYIYYEIEQFLSNINLLRRLLDKKYVTNTIIYLNVPDVINLIRLLVKYFNFEITNYSYLKNNDLKMCKKIISESVNYKELNVLFLPILRNQCINVGSFPKLFS